MRLLDIIPVILWLLLLLSRTILARNRQRGRRVQLLLLWSLLRHIPSTGRVLQRQLHITKRSRRLRLMERSRGPGPKHVVPKDRRRTRSSWVLRVHVHTHHLPHLLMQRTNTTPIIRVPRLGSNLRVLGSKRHSMNLWARMCRVRPRVIVAVGVRMVATSRTAGGAYRRIDAVWRASLEFSAVSRHGPSTRLAIPNERRGHAPVSSHWADVAATQVACNGVFEHARRKQWNVVESLFM